MSQWFNFSALKSKLSIFIYFSDIKSGGVSGNCQLQIITYISIKNACNLVWLYFCLTLYCAVLYMFSIKINLT